jgi:C-terminal processing protease CtpA/Prc
MSVTVVNTGIGATIVPSSVGGFEISSLSATGTARLHLQIGDRIMSIGSVATSGKTDDEVKALILGPAGSTISMVVFSFRPPVPYIIIFLSGCCQRRDQ